MSILGAKRVFVLLSVGSLTVGLPGCLGGCWGEARWAEPELGAWLDVHGYAAGFERAQPRPGLTMGPALGAVLPSGAELQSAQTRRTFDGLQARIIITLEGIFVNADSNDHPRRTVPVDDVVAFFNETLDAVHRGGLHNRTVAAQQLRDAWLHDQQRIDPDVRIYLEGPWDFDEVLGDSPGVFFDAPGFHRIEAGPWMFHAETRHWNYSWDGDHWLTVDTQGNARLDFLEKKTPDEARELARAIIPDYDWTFQGFEFKSSCEPRQLA